MKRRTQRQKRRDIGRYEEHRNRIHYRAHTYLDSDELSADEAIAEGLSEYLRWRDERDDD